MNFVLFLGLGEFYGAILTRQQRLVISIGLHQDQYKKKKIQIETPCQLSPRLKITVFYRNQGQHSLFFRSI
jgi:hypothetical protein